MQFYWAMLKTQKLHISEINWDQEQIGKNTCNISENAFPHQVLGICNLFCIDSINHRNLMACKPQTAGRTRAVETSIKRGLNKEHKPCSAQSCHIKFPGI